MSNYRFNLRLTKEAKEAVDSVDRGDKNKYINDAIETKKRNEFEIELLKEIKSISSSLETIAECMKNTDFSRIEAVPIKSNEKRVEKESEDNPLKEKLSDFIMQNVEM